MAPAVSFFWTCRLHKPCSQMGSACEPSWFQTINQECFLCPYDRLHGKSCSAQNRRNNPLCRTGQKRKNPCRSAYRYCSCLLYTSDAADEEDSVDLGGRRI